MRSTEQRWKRCSGSYHCGYRSVRGSDRSLLLNARCLCFENRVSQTTATSYIKRRVWGFGVRPIASIVGCMPPQPLQGTPDPSKLRSATTGYTAECAGSNRTSLAVIGGADPDGCRGPALSGCLGPSEEGGIRTFAAELMNGRFGAGCGMSGSSYLPDGTGHS